MNKSITSLKIKSSGYYQLRFPPTSKELTEYYRSVYFQKSKGNYQRKYSKEELVYIHNSCSITLNCVTRILPKIKSRRLFLDLGAGEGWLMKCFAKDGFSVTGVDLTSYAIAKFNKNLLKYFIETGIEEFIDSAILGRMKFDVINLTNVIEHVLKPEELLGRLKCILKPNGVLIITFPNDYSELQHLLLKKGKVKNHYWVTAPDHISYFDKKSFSKLTNKLGYKSELFLADFPIEIFLLNDFSNYIIDKTKGKQAHFSRVDFINLICKLDINSVVDLLIKFGEIGVGRNLTVFLHADKKYEH